MQFYSIVSYMMFLNDYFWPVKYLRKGPLASRRFIVSSWLGR